MQTTTDHISRRECESHCGECACTCAWCGAQTPADSASGFCAADCEAQFAGADAPKSIARQAHEADGLHLFDIHDAVEGLVMRERAHSPREATALAHSRVSSPHDWTATHASHCGCQS